MTLEDKHPNGVFSESKSDPKKTSSSVLKITPELSDAIYERLVSKQNKATEHSEALSKVSCNVRDFSEWKRKHNYPLNAKIFTISGWFPCVKEALLARGWIWNKDFSSPYYDLKWTNKTMDIEQESLQNWQLTNHFTKNVAITTKIGLLKSLESLNWCSDMKADDIIPRAYDMSDTSDLEVSVLTFLNQNVLKYLIRYDL